MSEQYLSVEYTCKHPSCQVFCKKGEIAIEKSYFEELSAEIPEEGVFKSPNGACRMGFSQPFKAVRVVPMTEEAMQAKAAEAEKASEKDPIARLSAEHQEVLKKLDIIEDQVRLRDVEGLWISTAAVENDIILHSIKKEEEVLFPLVRERIPMGSALIAIMDEDHREFISLLHGFRYALQEDAIEDGLVRSLMINLRNHIRKEDEEFFRFCNDYVSDEEKATMFAVMTKMEGEHKTLEAGDRKAKPLAPLGEDRKVIDAEIRSLKTVSSIGGEEMCCGGH
ncbi:MAG: hemerythrin domain-containing protein [Deltaproteobacteria bacterium]|nr:hemerythrin domain-containing protein [Deltaproteobacteria bacterium]